MRRRTNGTEARTAGVRGWSGDSGASHGYDARIVQRRPRIACGHSRPPWIAVVGIGLAADQKKRPRLSVRTGDGPAHEIALAPKSYAEERLTVPRRHVDLSPQEPARYERERVDR
jgi:hypothetical protein